ncbi:MAG: GntR family transcriptional regulator [Lentisphaeria bacterium]|nr:GntR family transcriptional regulator [Lentisphaeria bacterium]
MKNQALASFMRIRHYVFDWLAASKGSVMRLPSSRELAEKFGVSQPTVVRALQELVKEGFLTNRPGVGLFSNPGKLATREGRIWGVVFGDGRWAFLSRDAFHMASCIGRELLERDNHNLLKLITMGETQQEEFPELSMLSGICWWVGEEKVIPDMRRIAETVPVVVLSGRIPGFDCYYYDFEAENYEIARWMIANGSRRLALVMSGSHPEAIRGVERACEEANLAFPAGYILGPDRESEQELDRMVSLGCQPDGIIFNCKAIGFPEAIRRHPELDRCLIACDELWVDRKWQFTGLRVRTHFERVAAEVVDLLESGVNEMPRLERRLPVTHEIVTKSVSESNRRVKHETASLYID